MIPKREKFIDYVKVQRNSRYITIPVFIRRKLKLLPGDCVEIIISKSEVKESEIESLEESKEMENKEWRWYGGSL